MLAVPDVSCPYCGWRGLAVEDDHTLLAENPCLHLLYAYGDLTVNHHEYEFDWHHLDEGPLN